MNETYIKVKCVWKYPYRAVDKQCKTVDFLLTAKRFCDKAMGAKGDPNKIAMEKSGANKAAINAINAGRDVPIVLRQVKCFNNIVEEEHRAVMRVTRPMLNFKSFRSASSVLVGIELLHMIRKGQFAFDGAGAMSFADQYFALTGMVRSVRVAQCRSRKFRRLINNATEPYGAPGQARSHDGWKNLGSVQKRNKRLMIDASFTKLERWQRHGI